MSFALLQISQVGKVPLPLTNRTCFSLCNPTQTFRKVSLLAQSWGCRWSCLQLIWYSLKSCAIVSNGTIWRSSSSVLGDWLPYVLAYHCINFSAWSNFLLLFFSEAGAKFCTMIVDTHLLCYTLLGTFPHGWVRMRDEIKIRWFAHFYISLANQRKYKRYEKFIASRSMISRQEFLMNYNLPFFSRPRFIL